jgi:2-polyprenyl-6-methoxyphenol hydroxylase-like FAD-dependent oxidoreductase
VPVKRVCIVGAGIAGLSLAHALTNAPSLQRDAADELEVSIFDSREALDYTAGSGVQLNGGMACLGKINPDVQRAVIEAAIPISYLRGRHKSWSRENDVEKLWDYSVDEIIRSDETARKVLVDDNDKVLWYAIMRGALQETLVERLPKSRNVELVFGKTVTGINDLSGDALGGAYCQFADGSSAGPFDLIVGCDGIKSAVKEYVELGKISKDASKREGSAAALYSGIRINYAVQEQGGVEKNDPQPLQQCFADGAYAFSGIFGNGKDRPPCRCFFVTSLDDGFNGPFKRKLENGRDATQQIKSNTMDAASENADWTQNTRKPKDETREKMLEQIQRYGVVDESATSIISNADRFFELGKGIVHATTANS